MSLVMLWASVPKKSLHICENVLMSSLAMKTSDIFPCLIHKYDAETWLSNCFETDLTVSMIGSTSCVSINTVFPLRQLCAFLLKSISKIAYFLFLSNDDIGSSSTIRSGFLAKHSYMNNTIEKAFRSPKLRCWFPPITNSAWSLCRSFSCDESSSPIIWTSYL